MDEKVASMLEMRGHQNEDDDGYVDHYAPHMAVELDIGSQAGVDNVEELVDVDNTGVGPEQVSDMCVCHEPVCVLANTRVCMHVPDAHAHT